MYTNCQLNFSILPASSSTGTVRLIFRRAWWSLINSSNTLTRSAPDKRASNTPSYPSKVPLTTRIRSPEDKLSNEDKNSILKINKSWYINLVIKEKDLIKKVQNYNKFLNPETLSKAYTFALNAHKDQKRDSGDPYLRAFNAKV